MPNEFGGDPSTDPFVDRTYGFVIGHTWVIGSNKTNRLVLWRNGAKIWLPQSVQSGWDHVFFTFSDGTGPALVSSEYLNPSQQSRRVPVAVLGDDFSWTKGNHTWQFGGTFKDILSHNTNIADYNTVEVGMGGYVLSLCGGGGATCGSNPSLRPADLNTSTALGNLADYDYARHTASYSAVLRMMTPTSTTPPAAHR